MNEPPRLEASDSPWWFCFVVGFIVGVVASEVAGYLLGVTR